MAVVDPSLLDALRKYDTPTLSNAIETFGVRPADEGFISGGVRCLFPELGPMVGYAATGMIRSRGNGGAGGQEALYSHVETVPAPRIVVVQDIDDPPGHGAFWGEVQSTIFMALRCEGCVTNGAVRDLNEARQMGFQFFASAASVSRAYVRVVATGTEVSLGGLLVHPGDLLHADQHGVLQIPTEIAHELPAAADRVVAREQRLLSWVRSPEFNSAELPERRKQ
jgi:4-hydroxy-4-methyl-2-oxoglutarate aldolase